MSVDQKTYQSTHGKTHCGTCRGVALETHRIATQYRYSDATVVTRFYVDELDLSVLRLPANRSYLQAALTIPIDLTIDPAVSRLELS